MSANRIAVMAVAFACTALPAAAQPPAPPPALVASCESCHGKAGNTVSPVTPRLNGQTDAYLIARLKDLRIPTNQTVSAIHAMLDRARDVSDSTITALAAHFSAEAPTEPNGSAVDRAAGARLYAEGAGPLIPACASCHGDHGQGVGEAPRLAGQHAAYLQNQMEALMLTARIQTPMNKHAWALTAEQIRALTAFLAND